MITSFGSIEVSEKVIQTVIPAEEGIYNTDEILDSRFHGNDKTEGTEFLFSRE